MRFFKLTVLSVVATLLVSCGGPFTRVTKPEYTSSGQGYKVNLPVGWVQATGPQAGESLWISKDGYSLQSLRIDALKQDKAFVTLKKSVDTNIAISDLAELELAEFKAKNPNAASVKVLENSLAKVSNQKAYRLHLQYLNDKGLRFEQITYGFVSPKYYYKLAYQAPTIHYFQRDLSAFNQVVTSFKLNE